MSFEGSGQTGSVKSPMQPIRRLPEQGDTFQETGWSYPRGSVPDLLTVDPGRQEARENEESPRRRGTAADGSERVASAACGRSHTLGAQKERLSIPKKTTVDMLRTGMNDERKTAAP
jgi:hypothetical protein